jgi:hypothetical protein
MRELLFGKISWLLEASELLFWSQDHIQLLPN